MLFGRVIDFLFTKSLLKHIKGIERTQRSPDEVNSTILEFFEI